jgi:hypothetical protein
MRNLFASDRNPVLRSLAALFIGIGFFVVALRRDNADVFGDEWGAGAIFLCFAIPCVLLLAAGLLSPRGAEASPWQTVCVVFGLIFLPFALGQLVDWIGGPGDSGNSINVAWIFALTAAKALYAGAFGRVRYALFIASLSLIIAWLALWDEIVSGGLADHISTLRWLLILAAIGLAGLALFAPGRSSEIVTGATLTAVGAGAISVLALYGQNPFVTIPHADASFFWSLELLVVSLVAVLYGAGGGVRGPVYAGALGLVFFIAIVGLDLAHPDSPDGTLLGWPIVLLIVGLGAYLASFAPARGRGS